jgi:hypothetical protein
VSKSTVLAVLTVAGWDGPQKASHLSSSDVASHEVYISGLCKDSKESRGMGRLRWALSIRSQFCQLSRSWGSVLHITRFIILEWGFVWKTEGECCDGEEVTMR